MTRGSHEWLMAQAERIAAAGESAPRPARDPVNQPMVNNWVEALGDQNPVYVDADAAAASPHGELVAPPAMAQVWTMGGLNPRRDADDPLYATMSLLDEAGFTSVVATDTEQSYRRYLRLGEQVSVTTRLESLHGPKRTRLGEGYFVTTRNTWYVDGEEVASMRFRVLKFRPVSTSATSDSTSTASESTSSPSEQASSATGSPRPDPAAMLRPQVNRDSEYFWQGTRRHELRVQTCGSCGAKRHPPGPICPACQASERSYVVASGRGTVHSFVVHRHPPLPGREVPVVLALVDLDEGVRMVGELLEVSPSDARIGVPVEVTFVRVDDDLTLPAWRPAGRAR